VPYLNRAHDTKVSDHSGGLNRDRERLEPRTCRGTCYPALSVALRQRQGKPCAWLQQSRPEPLLFIRASLAISLLVPDRMPKLRRDGRAVNHTGGLGDLWRASEISVLRRSLGSEARISPGRQRAAESAATAPVPRIPRYSTLERDSGQLTNTRRDFDRNLRLPRPISKF